MYQYTSRPDRRFGMALSLGIAAVGLLTFLPFGLVAWLETLLRWLGFWMLLSAFPLAERFVLTSFTYLIERDENSGELQLVITERRGRRTRVVCRVFTSSLKQLIPPEGKKNRPRGRGVRRFNYCPDLRRRCHYLVLEDEGDIVLRFCPDKRLSELILSFIEGKND